MKSWRWAPTPKTDRRGSGAQLGRRCRRDLDVEGHAETLGETAERGKGRLVLARFETRHVGLTHTELASQLGLRQSVYITAVISDRLDDAEPRNLRAFLRRVFAKAFPLGQGTTGIRMTNQQVSTTVNRAPETASNEPRSVQEATDMYMSGQIGVDEYRRAVDRNLTDYGPAVRDLAKGIRRAQLKARVARFLG